jgi:hypothetical protein
VLQERAHAERAALPSRQPQRLSLHQRNTR